MSATADAPVMVAPTFHSAPDYEVTLGPEVADLAAAVGYAPYPEQRLGLDDLFAIRPGNPSRSAAFEFAAVCCRQNLKTGLFKQAALGWLFLTKQRLVIWSAHEFDTAAEAFRDMSELIEGSAMLSRRVKAITRGNGDEAIELHGGQRLRFKARTSGGGRGLSGDRVVLDEGFALQPAHMGALMPTLSARPDPQLVYGSSAGHLKSAVLRGVRDRGRSGTDPGLAYMEWCIPGHPTTRLPNLPGFSCEVSQCDHRRDTPGCVLDRLDLLRLANPLMGRSLLEETVLAERRALPLEEFMRERAGWWEDPVSEGGALDFTRWLDLADPTAERGSFLVIGVDQGADRDCCLAIAWDRPDGGVQVQLGQQAGGRVDTALTTSQALARIKAIAARFGDVTVVLGGPSEAMEQDLLDAGLDVRVMSSDDFAGACGQVEDLLRDGDLHHGNQDELNASVKGAEARYVGTAGKRAWVLKDAAGIGPLAAATRAVGGLGDAGGVLVW